MGDLQELRRRVWPSAMSSRTWRHRLQPPLCSQCTHLNFQYDISSHVSSQDPQSAVFGVDSFRLSAYRRPALRESRSLPRRPLSPLRLSPGCSTSSPAVCATGKQHTKPLMSSPPAKAFCSQTVPFFSETPPFLAVLLLPQSLPKPDVVAGKFVKVSDGENAPTVARALTRKQEGLGAAQALRSPLVSLCVNHRPYITENHHIPPSPQPPASSHTKLVGCSPGPAAPAPNACSNPRISPLPNNMLHPTVERSTYTGNPSRPNKHPPPPHSTPRE